MAVLMGSLQSVSVHRIGNKTNGGAITLSEHEVNLTDEVRSLLETYFTKSFKFEIFYHFDHENSLEYNEVYQTAGKVFQSELELHEASVALAKRLFDHGDHAQIKSGEFYTAFFQGCTLDGRAVNAIGLFKSETKDTFFKVETKGNGFEINASEGISLSKLDKGCMIFNYDREEGYTVAAVDHTNKGGETRYWVERFLSISRMNDAYLKTENELAICKRFISEALPAGFEVSKADQADLLNRSMEYFNENEQFNLEDFGQTVMEQPQVIHQFKTFHTAQEGSATSDSSFDISSTAVKSQKRFFKSIIKLDKNFHVYVHGNSSMIERGQDDNGRKFYKLYFDEEN